MSKPKSKSASIPAYNDLMVPTVEALKVLGGSGTTTEIYEKVIEILNLPPAVLEVLHTDTGQGEVEYRLAWSRTYLKKNGIVNNSSRGVWSLVDTDIDPKELDPRDIVKVVRDGGKPKGGSNDSPPSRPDLNVPVTSTEIADSSLTWQTELHKLLLSLAPEVFERLAQRLLRESGFVQVEVTGKSGDGGIDGIGIARINGFLSFHVLFQCKRYQGSVTPSQIRDFRGAMQGRTDKGLFITTGTFTRDAVKEATRDGAPPIDLIDGEHLVKRLKELGLGVRIEMVEEIEVDTNWFSRL